MAKPDTVYNLGDSAFIQCPECGTVGEVDAEQMAGEVSIDCPNCDYHETHDLTEL